MYIYSTAYTHSEKENDIKEWGTAGNFIDTDTAL